ncbi:MAG TPA: hypothetical protein VK689_03045 [Armatimonadota bacterium]|nr:hypothetical protein [Armatimonadota bacterium]
MQSEARVPMHVAFDVGQGEGTTLLTWERAQWGVFGLPGYQTGGLQLRCHFCEAAFSVPHSRENKRPFSVRHGDGGALLVECLDCRAARGVEPLTTEAR